MKTKVRLKAKYTTDYPDQTYTVLSHYRWLGYTKVFVRGDQDGFYYRPFNFEVEEISDGNTGAPQDAEVRKPEPDSGESFGSAYILPVLGAQSGRSRSDRPNGCGEPQSGRD